MGYVAGSYSAETRMVTGKNLRSGSRDETIVFTIVRKKLVVDRAGYLQSLGMFLRCILLFAVFPCSERGRFKLFRNLFGLFVIPAGE